MAQLNAASFLIDKRRAQSRGVPVTVRKAVLPEGLCFIGIEQDREGQVQCSMQSEQRTQESVKRRQNAGEKNREGSAGTRRRRETVSRGRMGRGPNERGAPAADTCRWFISPSFSGKESDGESVTAEQVAAGAGFLLATPARPSGPRPVKQALYDEGMRRSCCHYRGHRARFKTPQLK
ncbi:hypothetical protein SKAU_G00103650 [Synaphobranchus kaupii]|uniref:Uncharacterized protein n=1 Tax=Synaphobranchus kaupii TaxID=118154 RepID=A0A9Q1J6L8_SYNKA|nr:hypothetical protein SKAU_G00103650 [Synaphobranchus kaupii]